MNKNICKKYRGLLLLAGGLVSAAVDGTADAGYPVPAVVSERDTAAILYELGVSRMNGEGKLQDIVQGRYWIHLAARHGYPLAQYNLGVMYFDGIGGEYNRLCAQWWLNRAAAQDDPEVYQMAGQALQSMLPEMSALPKVYRPVSAAECDRLPVWSQEARLVAYTQVLPEVDIDTEKMVVIQEESAAPVPDGDPEAGYGVIGTAPAEVVTATDTVTEIRPEPATVTGVITDKGSETVSGNVQGISLPDDADNAGSGQNNESGNGKAGTSVPVITTPVQGSTELGKKVVRRQEDSSAEADEKVKVLKPEPVRAAPVLNLGGEPATAPGKHYTLQLSGGTTPDELYRAARRHKLTNYVVYETERHGRRWYVLVAGEYATLTAANQALKALPAELRRNGPWVRSVRQVQAELK